MTDQAVAPAEMKNTVRLVRILRTYATLLAKRVAALRAPPLLISAIVRIIYGRPATNRFARFDLHRCLYSY